MGDFHKQDKYKIMIIILSFLFILTLSYIGLDKFNDYKQIELIKSYQQGYDQGYNQGIYAAVLSLYQQTENCQITTINVGNFTRKVIDADCK